MSKNRKWRLIEQDHNGHILEMLEIPNVGWLVRNTLLGDEDIGIGLTFIPTNSISQTLDIEKFIGDEED